MLHKNRPNSLRFTVINQSLPIEIKNRRNKNNVIVFIADNDIVKIFNDSQKPYVKRLAPIS